MPYDGHPCYSTSLFNIETNTAWLTNSPLRIWKLVAYSPMQLRLNQRLKLCLQRSFLEPSQALAAKPWVVREIQQSFGVARLYQLSRGLCVLHSKLTRCPSSLGGQQVLANPESSMRTTGKPKTLLSFLWSQKCLETLQSSHSRLH